MPYASDGDEMKHNPSVNDTVSTYRWIMAGGRGIDSAWSYDHGGYGLSQRQMGLAIQRSKVPRASLFVTTKIPCNASAAGAAAAIDCPGPPAGAVERPLRSQ
jgi:diketogulonate reductase-like aldo/keto reductase